MRRHRFLSWFLTFALAGVAAQAVRANETPLTNAQINTLIHDNSSFALAFYRQLHTSEGNLFFSPYSISTALALVYGGARGETEKQMAKTLHFSLDQSCLHLAFSTLQSQLNAMEREGGLRLFVANSLRPQQGDGFLSAYLSLAKERYGVSLTPVDYEQATEGARRQINLWVKEKTEQKIKDLIQPGVLDAGTKLVVVNAIYFQGAWASKFDPKRTQDCPFLVAPGKSVTAPLMTQTARADYAETETLQILSLPYLGGLSSMLVLLPKKTDGLQQLQEDLSLENLRSWEEQLRSRKVEIFLPRFKVTQQASLNALLQAMGMADAFRYPMADFSGIAEGRELFLSAVIHKAFVAVNEEGTEAAAATAVALRAGGLGPVDPPGPPPVFRADHPFLFLIRDNTSGTILFLGRLTDPTQSP
jgi:serpin B